MLPAQLENYLTCETAKEIWDKIALILEQKSATNKATLLQRLYTCQMTTSEMVVQYVTKVLNMAHALRDLDEKISDADVIAMILGSLPEKYSAFATAWDSVDLSKQTVDTLQERLIKEEQKLSEREERHLRWCNSPTLPLTLFYRQNMYK